jgi:hypothetical protein
MDEPGARRRLGGRATEVVERYGVERVLSLWETLLAEVAPVAFGAGVPVAKAGARRAP